MSPRLLAALIAAVSLVPAAAIACSCAPPPAPADALAAADAVFEARILSGPTGGEAAADGTPYFGPVRYAVEVLRTWKGSPEPRSEILTSSQGSMCGRSFEVGANYLVYAYRDKQGNLGDSICTRTRTSKSAADDFAALGAGTPLPASPAKPGEAPDGPTDVPNDANPVEAPADTAEATPAPDAPGSTGGDPTPAPVEDEEDEDDANTDPSCSVASGASGLGLALMLPFLVARRRR